MTQIDPSGEFSLGLKRFPFHAIILTIILILGANGIIPPGQATLLMSILAGVMISPFYNGLAGFMYISTDKFFQCIYDKLPECLDIILLTFLGWLLVGADVYSITEFGFIEFPSIYFLSNTIIVWGLIIYQIYSDIHS